MTSNTINYTIIIPHYNSSDKLRRLLSTIPRRNDIQVIVVDDCSDSLQLKKLKSLQNFYSNVKFIFSNQNLGGGGARNKGLCLANGRYILFADADDYFNPCIDSVLDDYATSDIDIIYLNAVGVDETTFERVPRASHISDAIKKYLVSKDFFDIKYKFTHPWAKLIKREIIESNNIKFDETPISNDVTFSTLIDYYAISVHADLRVSYCTVDCKDSVSKKLSPQRAFIRLGIDLKRYQFLSDNKIVKKDPYTFISWALTPIFSSNDKNIQKASLDLCKNAGIKTKSVLHMVSKFNRNRKIKILLKQLFGKKIQKIHNLLSEW